MFHQFVVQMGQASGSDDTSLEIGPTKDAAHMVSGSKINRRALSFHYENKLTSYDITCHSSDEDT